MGVEYWCIWNLPKYKSYLRDCPGRNRYNLTMASLAYGLMALGNAILTGVMSGWLLYFYLPPNGQPLVPVMLYGIAILLSRLIYILSSIPIDHLIRRTRSRWGSHLPYILGGALCMPFLFILLWTPPHAGTSLWN